MTIAGLQIENHFNSRAHVERDGIQAQLDYLSFNFNSRAHVERDLSIVSGIILSASFQLTRSRGARQFSVSFSLLSKNFNSRAHVERDVAYICRLRLSVISTHALTWSATVAQKGQYLIGKISTHALTWSATETKSYDIPRFNISTHALTWSATYMATSRSSKPQNFNSRAHVERDGQRRAGTEGRLNFNSRAHVERDDPDPFLEKACEISTHALTWSATHCQRRADHNERISTHALTWSATVAVCRGVRLGISFQLTRSRGARQTKQALDKLTKVISTHALTWSATAKRAARS